MRWFHVEQTSIPWTPTQLTLDAWYDASDASTIITDVNGIIGVNDKTVNAFDLVKGTPSLAAGTVNGLATVDFITSTDILTGPRPTTNVAIASSFFIVTNLGAATNGVVLRGTLSKFMIVPQVGSGSTLISVGLGTITYHLNGNASPWTTRGDMYTELVGSTNITGATGLNLAGLQSMTYFNFNTSFFCRGDFCEAIWVNGTIGTTDRQLIEGYLAWKWQGNGNALPVGHPYRNAPPTI